MTAAPSTKTPILISALRILSVDIQSKDGIANAAILEGAQRLEELQTLLAECLPHVQAAAQSEHTLSSIGPRHELPIDRLVNRVKNALK